MPVLSQARAGIPTLAGLVLKHRGKVRDVYRLPDGLLLIVATNAVSAYDFVLGALFPQKGMILNGTSLFWTQKLEEDLKIPTHLVAAGRAIDEYLPEHLRGDPELQSRAIVVCELNMIPVEFVARGYLTGSGLDQYQADHSICGHRLPEGLQNGDELPYALDSPTTKAQEGHDKALDAATVRRKHPVAVFHLLQVYGYARWFSRTRGLILADTKLEMGTFLMKDVVLIGDEIITPDSSRYWDGRVWEVSRQPTEGRKAPPALDKQLVRVYVDAHGINSKLDPLDPVNIERAQSLVLPERLVRSVTQAYRYLFWRLTGQQPEMFLGQYGVALPAPPLKKVAVLLGSLSDLSELHINPTYKTLFGEHLKGHAISCHRNPEELDAFVRTNCDGAQTVIAVGGKAFALPGVVKALIDAQGLDIPVIGVALGEPGSESFEAARLSIKQLPGQPVVMDELTGEPYAGTKGFNMVLNRIAFGELPPPQPQEPKPAEFNIAIE